MSTEQERKTLDAVRRAAGPVYSPVRPLAGDWRVGRIQEHVAKPLTEEEVKVACDALMALPSLLSEVSALTRRAEEAEKKLAELGVVFGSIKFVPAGFGAWSATIDGDHHAVVRAALSAPATQTEKPATECTCGDVGRDRACPRHGDASGMMAGMTCGKCGRKGHVTGICPGPPAPEPTPACPCHGYPHEPTCTERPVTLARKVAPEPATTSEPCFALNKDDKILCTLPAGHAGNHQWRAPAPTSAGDEANEEMLCATCHAADTALCGEPECAVRRAQLIREQRDRLLTQLASLRADLERVTRERDEAEHAAEEAQAGWRCFNCGEFFATEIAAREHFGDGGRELIGTPYCVSPLRSDEKERLAEVQKARQEAEERRIEAAKAERALGVRIRSEQFPNAWTMQEQLDLARAERDSAKELAASNLHRLQDRAELHHAALCDLETVKTERDAALARAEQAEKERDARLPAERVEKARRLLTAGIADGGPKYLLRHAKEALAALSAEGGGTK